MTLNQEQQQLVADNYRLIFAFANRKNINVEEYSDILSISLCKAATTFKGTSAFSTYAFQIMENDLSNEFRFQNSQCRNSNNIAFSLDDVVSTDSLVTYGDIVINSNAPDILENLMIGEIWELFSPVEQTVVEGLLLQKTQQEMSIELGCSRSNIAMLVTSIRMKTRKYLED